MDRQTFLTHFSLFFFSFLSVEKMLMHFENTSFNLLAGDDHVMLLMFQATRHKYLFVLSTSF